MQSRIEQCKRDAIASRIAVRAGIKYFNHGDENNQVNNPILHLFFLTTTFKFSPLQQVFSLPNSPRHPRPFVSSQAPTETLPSDHPSPSHTPHCRFLISSDRPPL